MALNIRLQDDVAIVSNFARLMNDPRYTSADLDVRRLAAEGFRKFVFELANVNETGDAFLGLLMTLTRSIRRAKGEVVLAHPSRGLSKTLEAMQLQDFWDVFPSVDAAREFFGERGPGPIDDDPAE